MKRLVIDVYDEVHRQVKCLAFSQGVTMKVLLERVVMEYLRTHVVYLKNNNQDGE